MPRVNKIKDTPLPAQTLVVDNGGYSIKAGFVNDTAGVGDCHVIPNCLARDRNKHVWIGAQLDKCHDFGELTFRRPVEKGYLVNWEAEKTIWDNTFLNPQSILHCSPNDTNLILTEAPNSPIALQASTDQIVFEEYEFATYSRWTGPTLNAYHCIPSLFGDVVDANVSHQPAECLLVIDCGYSHTTVSPLWHGKVIQDAVRRLEVGGKFLTNYLKELVSIRHYNLLDEVYLMNTIKESVCFVSQNFSSDLERAWTSKQAKAATTVQDERALLIDYVLPDYNASRAGYVRPYGGRNKIVSAEASSTASGNERPEEFMTLGNERFTVPELLFRPDDVGLEQPGIPSMVFQSLSRVPTGLWPSMLANILVTGGTCQMDGFLTRLEQEIRQLAPSECIVRIRTTANPVTSNWLGGARVGEDGALLQKIQVTKEEYLENGSSWMAKVFSQRTKPV